MEDPAITFFDRMATIGGKFPDNSDNKEKSNTNEYTLDILDQLVAAEENYYANILLKCLKMCSTAFGMCELNSTVINIYSRCHCVELNLSYSHTTIQNWNY